MKKKKTKFCQIKTNKVHICTNQQSKGEFVKSNKGFLRNMNASILITLKLSNIIIIKKNSVLINTLRHACIQTYGYTDVVLRSYQIC